MFLLNNRRGKRGSAYGQIPVSRETGNGDPDARVRPAVVGWIGATAGLSQFDVRLLQSGSGGARVCDRAGEGARRRSGSAGSDLRAAKPSERGDSRRPTGSPGAWRRGRRSVQFGDGGDLQRNDGDVGAGAFAALYPTVVRRHAASDSSTAGAARVCGARGT